MYWTAGDGLWNYRGIEAFVVVARSQTTSMMSSSSGKKFCKTASCPSSQNLLRYRRHRLQLGDRAAIETHLRSCDFCNAELQLLMRHRSTHEEFKIVEMPRQLRRLAEDLLTRAGAPHALIGFSNNH